MAHVLLALAHVHVQQLWAFDANEGHLALFGNALSEQSLASAGRTVEEQTSTRFDPLVEYLGVGDREEDGLHDLLLGSLQSAHVVPADLNEVVGLLLFDQFCDLFEDVCRAEMF